LERRVEERSAELIAKNLELEGFTYSISHDMRAPLRAIVSRASIVLEEESGALSPEGQEHLRRLSRAANNMAALVDDLLKYARIGTHQVQLERVDLAVLAVELSQEVQREYENSTFKFSFLAGSEVCCDARLIGMALRNLFDNACKYRSTGQAANVEFGSRLESGERVFYVRDCGIGFDMAYVGKLFKPFERLHREEYPGTGIGLANVRRVIERHGGQVWAQSQIGQGSTFYFTIPDSCRPGPALHTAPHDQATA
jgi:light-regulated signal transduction histidine kinase (bacteriophytochrome)